MNDNQRKAMFAKARPTVYAIISKQGCHGIFKNKEDADFYCGKIDSRIARNPKVEYFGLNRNLTDAGYSIYDKSNKEWYQG